jgi:hypothetical protein
MVESYLRRNRKTWRNSEANFRKRRRQIEAKKHQNDSDWLLSAKKNNYVFTECGPSPTLSNPYPNPQR